jgi:uncharacterized membrane protein HdeD (DUF308 family)
MKANNSMGQSSGWSIALGVIMIILGLAAIAAPVLTSLAIELVLGWLFIVGSIIQVIYIFQRQHRVGSLVLNLLIAILTFMIGLLLITNPWAGIISITLLIGIYFFMDGVFRVLLSFQIKPGPRWAWVLFNGILMIILGILIWSQWPFNAAWILGLLVGIGLLVNGLVTIIYGITDSSLGDSTLRR